MTETERIVDWLAHQRAKIHAMSCEESYGLSSRVEWQTQAALLRALIAQIKRGEHLMEK